MSLQTLRHTHWLLVALAAVALLGMALPSSRLNLPLVHFLPLHTLLEFSSIAAAFLVFATVWHTPAKETRAAPLWIAVALFAAGWLDFAHTLSYKGMPDFITPASPQKAIAFWLAARLLVAITLFIASFLPLESRPERTSRRLILGGYTALNLAILWLVLGHEDKLPATFIDGVGVTDFKVAVEWLIIAALLAAAWRFLQRTRREGGGDFATPMFAAAIVAAMGEVFFTQYSSVSDMQNLLGHIYKVISYVLIYRAMFVISIRSPFVRLAEQGEHLRKVNERLKFQALALESAATPILITRRDGSIRWANPAHLSSAGFGADEIRDRQTLFAAPISADLGVAAAMEKAVQGGQPWHGRIAVLRKDGSPYVEDRTVTPVLGEDGAIEGFVAVSEDVTEQIRAEAAARESAERYRSLYSNMLNGYAYCEILRENGNARDFVYLDVNPAFHRLTGLQDVVGRRVSEVIPGLIENQPELLAFYDTVVTTGTPAHVDFHVKGLDVWLSISAYCAGPGRFVAVFDNITDRKNAEVTRAQLERQLQQAQKMEALGQLTGGIAHDFNNILAAILGYANLALERFVPDKESKLANYLREVVAASERARDLIAKMLNYSRVQPARSVAVLNPAPKVREALAMMRSTLPASIDLDVDIDDTTPPIRLDAVDLDQILVNLLINARDAIDGHGRIGLRLRQLRFEEQAMVTCAICQTPLRGDYVALEVSDSGCGIPPEIIGRIFDPFFTTKEVGRGSGLGLSVVQGILRRSGGHALVKSIPQRGTVFQLLFTIAPSAADDTPPASRSGTGVSGGGETLWLVDDEAAVTGYLSELFGGLGYRVRSFNDPADLLLAFRTEGAKVDLVITDQTMPGLNGTDLAQALMALRPSLPIILCTGYSDGIDRATTESLGIRRYFTKPVNAAELLATVREALNDRKIS